MKHGYVLAYGDARTTAELAELAESHGWDGFFVWEPIWGIDAWVSLAAAAMRTERIRLGTLLTPLPRKRPWEIASQAATVDNLSGGRVNMTVGLGATDDRFWLFEDDPGRRVRAEMLDEGLAMLQHLWRDEPFEFSGKHYSSRAIADPMPPVPPPPVQQPRIPLWVVGAWPRSRSMRRAAQWDGWLPEYHPVGDPAGSGQPAELTPAGLAEGVEWIRAERAAAGLPMDGYDVIMEGTTPADDPAAAAGTVGEWAQAGATWWLEIDFSSLDPEVVRAGAERRLRAGPPTSG